MSTPEELESEATVESYEKKEDMNESVEPQRGEEIEENIVHNTEKAPTVEEEEQEQNQLEDPEKLIETSEALQESTSEDPVVGEQEEQGDQ
ncbi:unnamed protein product, partial [Cylicostephanus goldi]